MAADDLFGFLDEPLCDIANGDYDDALRKLERLEITSANPAVIARVRLLETACLTEMNQWNEALIRLGTVDHDLLDETARLDYKFESARIERLRRNFAVALDLVDHALATIDSSEDLEAAIPIKDNLLVLKGIILAESGQCEAAIPILSAVPQDHPGWAQATVWLGDCYYNAGETEAALMKYVEVIQDTSHYIDPVYRDNAIRNVGAICYYGGDYLKAVGYLTKVAESYRAYPETESKVHEMLAASLRHLGRDDEAAHYDARS